MAHKGNPPSPESKPKTETEINAEILDAREGAIIDILSKFKSGQKGKSKKDVEDAEKSLKELSEKRDVKPGVVLIKEIIEEKIKDEKYAPDLMVSKYIEGVVDKAVEKVKNGITVAELEELELFEKYLGTFQGDRKKEVEDLEKKISELKSKLVSLSPPPKDKPAEDEEEKTKQENNKQKNMAVKVESKPSVEEPEEDFEREINPESAFEQVDKKAVESMTTKYAEENEVGADAKKTIDALLDNDSFQLRKDFALEWFKDPDNQARMKKEGLPVENVKDDYKVDFVLKHWQSKSKENPYGWGLGEEIKTEKYKGLGEELKKIEVLKVDLAKEKMPPETPFLTLNYLAKSVALEKIVLDDLKERARKGDKEAETLATGKEKELENLFFAQKELVEKTMHEDLTGKAMIEIQLAEGYMSKDEYTRLQKNDARDLVNQEKANEQVKKEWEAMSDAQKAKYGNDQNNLKEAIRLKGEGLGLSADETFALQTSGYNIQSAETLGTWGIIKGIFSKGGPRLIYEIATGGEMMEVVCDGNKKTMTEREIKKTAEESARKQDEGSVILAQEHLEKAWDEWRDNRVKAISEDRIAELAKSIEGAEGGVKEVYKKARERIMAEYIRGRVEKNPETKEQIGNVEQELHENKKDKSIGDFITDTYNRTGGLERIQPNWANSKGIIKKYLSKEMGFNIDQEELDKVSPEEYASSWEKTRMGLFEFLMKLMQSSQEIRARKAEKKTKTKRKK